jgi:hypothetical protein
LITDQDDDTILSANSQSQSGGDDQPSPIGLPAAVMGNAAVAVVGTNPAPSGWLSVIRSDDEAGTINLRKVRRQRKPPVSAQVSMQLELTNCLTN